MIESLYESNRSMVENFPENKILFLPFNYKHSYFCNEKLSFLLIFQFFGSTNAIFSLNQDDQKDSVQINGEGTFVAVDILHRVL